MRARVEDISEEKHMARGNAKASTTNVDPTNTLSVSATAGTDPATLAAKVALRPDVRAAVTTRNFSQIAFGTMDLTTMVDELAAQIDAVRRGDLGRVETMLTSQAHALDAIFHELARRAGLNMGEYLDAAETYMRLALKAQSQCRATLETLAEIKNPRPVAFVQQANIANGPQQVNNGTAPPPSESPRAGENENRQNKLLEHGHGERLDTGTTGAASGIGADVEAMGAVNRSADGAR
jgi:hypothetical protein